MTFFQVSIEFLKNNFEKYGFRNKIQRENRWCTPIFDLIPQCPQNEAPVPHKFENFQKKEYLTDKLKKYDPGTKIQLEKRWCTPIFYLTPQSPLNGAAVPHKF